MSLPSPRIGSNHQLADLMPIAEFRRLGASSTPRVYESLCTEAPLNV
jgi:hypothetical protein